MGITATNSSAPRELVPSGNHVARCYQMIHIGTYEDEYMGEPKVVNKVRITFELSNELRVFKEENGEQPMVIDKEYTLSLSEKSNLRKDLESWRGKAFTEQEVKGFDITKLLDNFCMVNVIHKKTGQGKDYAYISNISPLPKGMPKPEKFNDVFIFDYENNFNPEFVEKLPDFIKGKILSSNEWNDRLNQLEGAEHQRQFEAKMNDEPKDDLPF